MIRSGQTRKVDPLGRNHQSIGTRPDRSKVDAVCNYILSDKRIRKDFERKGTGNHVYFDAYTLIFGFKAAVEMLDKVRK